MCSLSTTKTRCFDLDSMSIPRKITIRNAVLLRQRSEGVGSKPRGNPKIGKSQTDSIDSLFRNYSVRRGRVKCMSHIRHKAHASGLFTGVKTHLKSGDQPAPDVPAPIEVNGKTGKILVDPRISTLLKEFLSRCNPAPKIQGVSDRSLIRPGVSEQFQTFPESRKSERDRRCEEVLCFDPCSNDEVNVAPAPSPEGSNRHPAKVSFRCVNDLPISWSARRKSGEVPDYAQHSLSALRNRSGPRYDFRLFASAREYLRTSLKYANLFHSRNIMKGSSELRRRIGRSLNCGVARTERTA